MGLRRRLPHLLRYQRSRSRSGYWSVVGWHQSQWQCAVHCVSIIVSCHHPYTGCVHGVTTGPMFQWCVMWPGAGDVMELLDISDEHGVQPTLSSLSAVYCDHVSRYVSCVPSLSQLSWLPPILQQLAHPWSILPWLSPATPLPLSTNKNNQSI